jgi:hypothetical protein
MDHENARPKARRRAQDDDHEDERILIRYALQSSRRIRYTNVRRSTSAMSARSTGIRMRQIVSVDKFRRRTLPSSTVGSGLSSGLRSGEGSIFARGLIGLSVGRALGRSTLRQCLRGLFARSHCFRTGGLPAGPLRGSREGAARDLAIANSSNNLVYGPCRMGTKLSYRPRRRGARRHLRLSGPMAYPDLN